MQCVVTVGQCERPPAPRVVCLVVAVCTVRMPCETNGWLAPQSHSGGYFHIASGMRFDSAAELGEIVKRTPVVRIVYKRTDVYPWFPCSATSRWTVSLLRHLR